MECSQCLQAVLKVVVDVLPFDYLSSDSQINELEGTWASQLWPKVNLTTTVNETITEPVAV